MAIRATCMTSGLYTPLDLLLFFHGHRCKSSLSFPFTTVSDVYLGSYRCLIHCLMLKPKLLNSFARWCLCNAVNLLSFVPVKSFFVSI